MCKVEAETREKKRREEKQNIYIYTFSSPDPPAGIP